MKRFLFGFLAVFFLVFNTLPYLHIMADDMPTSSQYEMLGAYALSSLITSGEATELDFSDYTESDTSFLIDLGEAIFTGDWSGLAEDGLEWLGDTADSVYDSYKEYVSQWKADHLGIMYSDWFPDERISIDYSDGEALAKPLRELFTPRGDNNPTPNPDINYAGYLNNINGSGFWWKDYPNNIAGNGFGLRNPPSINYSWFNSPSDNGIPFYETSGLVLYLYNNSNILTINLTSVDGTYYFNYSFNSFAINGGFNVNNNGNKPATYGRIQVNGKYFIGVYPQSTNYEFHWSVSGSLEHCLQYCQNHFRNVNIYVDGVPWSIIDNNEPTYPIVIPGQLTIYNNQPLEYSFPPDTHINLPDLTNIIRNAINSSGVVMWSDIADVFIDVNGQTAVAVTKIVRNDYDNLYMEQYPYPAMLVGMTEQTKFNEHLLDNSHAYLSPINTVVENTIGVLPSELVSVLAIGAILTIFAVIINRLLE